MCCVEYLEKSADWDRKMLLGLPRTRYDVFLHLFQSYLHPNQNASYIHDICILQKTIDTKSSGFNCIPRRDFVLWGSYKSYFPMADQNSSEKFGLGLIFGAIAGAVATFFLTPTTGEENRKKAKEIFEKVKIMVEEGEVEQKAKELFGDVSEEGKRLIAEARTEILEKMDEVKSDIDNFDKAKFMKFVNETVTSVGARVKASSTQMEKLKASFLAKFEGEEKKVEKARKVLKPKISA